MEGGDWAILVFLAFPWAMFFVMFLTEEVPGSDE